MKPIGTDDQIKGLSVIVPERDLRAVTGLGDVLDDITEDDVDVPCLLHQDLAQVAAHDLEVPAAPVSELVAAHLADDVAVAIDQLGATHLRTRLDDRVMRIHPVRDVERRPAHVDLVPTCPQRRRSIDDGRG
jgi:hypothetical protein